MRLRWFLGLSLSLLLGCGKAGGGALADDDLGGGPTTADAPGRRSASGQDCIRAGACSTKQIVEGLEDLGPITWSEGAAWAVSSGAITRIDADGVKTLKTTASSGSHVAVAGGVIFWDNAYNLNLMKPGETSKVVVAASMLDRPCDLIAVGTRLYFRQDDRVLWTDVVDPSKAVSVSLPSSYAYGGRHPLVMTVDSAKKVFWLDGSTFDPIEIKTIEAGVVSTLGIVEDAHRAFGLTTTPTHLVFADYDHRAILAIPKQGGKPVSVAEDQVDTYTIVADDTGIYWLSRSGLMRAETDGSGARRLLELEFDGSVGYLAVAPDAIYITDASKGVILRVQK